MGLTDTQRCGKDGCEKTWPRDPVLEVPCPSCGADVGELCKRPSGHGVWGTYGRFHDARDTAAFEAGAYGTCPNGQCPPPPSRPTGGDRAAVQTTLSNLDS